ncbi:MAG: nuclear transport factor 2 family protein [Terriglobales bacterium]
MGNRLPYGLGGRGHWLDMLGGGNCEVKRWAEKFSSVKVSIPFDHGKEETTLVSRYNAHGVFESEIHLPFKESVAMKAIAAFASILALLTGVPVLLAQTTGSATSNDKKAEEEVRRLNDEEIEAFLQKDPKAMARLWSDDLVVTNPLNKFVNKQAVLGMVESGFLVITSYTRQIEYIRMYGDTAIVAGSEAVMWGGKMPNAGKTEHLRFTGIWMRQGGRWQEVARHANIVPEQ